MSASESTLRMTAPQRDVLMAALSPHVKLVLAVAGIRGGKTDIGGKATLLRAMEQPTEADQCHAVVSPTFPMSKIGPEAKLLKVLYDKTVFPECPLVGWAKSDRAFFIRNAVGGVSKIRIFSGENPHRWRGDAWLSLWADEAARLDGDAWDVAQGRLADTDGPALFTTTPDGYNFVYDLSTEATEVLPRAGYNLRVSHDRSVVFVSWGSMLNTFLRSTRGFDRLAKRYDPDTYAQEVLAQFIARSGRVYKAFTRETCVQRRPFLPGAMVQVGQDFNVERMATVFSQVVPATKGGEPGIHAFAEMELRDADTYRLVRELKQWSAAHRVPWTKLEVNPDASSRKRQTAGSRDTARSDLEIIERAGLRVRAFRANPHVKDRVNAVNGLFHNQRASVSPDCPLLIEALEKQKWEQGEGGSAAPEKDGVLDNRADAFGYSVWYKFPLRAQRASFGDASRRAA